MYGSFWPISARRVGILQNWADPSASPERRIHEPGVRIRERSNWAGSRALWVAGLRAFLVADLRVESLAGLIGIRSRSSTNSLSRHYCRDRGHFLHLPLIDISLAVRSDAPVLGLDLGQQDSDGVFGHAKRAGSGFGDFLEERVHLRGCLLDTGF